MCQDYALNRWLRSIRTQPAVNSNEYRSEVLLPNSLEGECFQTRDRHTFTLARSSSCLSTASKHGWWPGRKNETTKGRKSMKATPPIVIVTTFLLSLFISNQDANAQLPPGYHASFYATSSPSATIRNFFANGATVPFMETCLYDDCLNPLRIELLDPDIYNNRDPNTDHGPNPCPIIRAGHSDPFMPFGVYYWGGPNCRNPSTEDSPNLTFILCSEFPEHDGIHLHCRDDLELFLQCDRPFPQMCTIHDVRKEPEPTPRPQTPRTPPAPEPMPIGNLEVPGEGSFQSGIGFISGWVCDGKRVDIIIDGGLYLPPVARNIARGDTEENCGDQDNGFVLHWNWNLMGDGEYTAQLVVDGKTLDTNTFTVTTLGEEFLQGLSRQVTIPNFPSEGEEATLSWQEPVQNFIIVPNPSTP